MRTKILAATLALVTTSSAIAQPLVATKAMCNAIGMQAYSALNTDLGAGTIYQKLGSGGPQSGLLKCQNVFSGMEIAKDDEISGRAFIGENEGTKSLDAGLGLSFLKGIIDKNSNAKVDSSLNRGKKWSVKTGDIYKTGVTQLRAQEYTFAASSNCANRIRAIMGKNKSVTVTLVYQSAGTKDIDYSIEKTGGGGFDASINLGPFVSINPKFKISNTSGSKLNVSASAPINTCYMKMDWKIRTDKRIGPNRFILSKI